MKNYIYFFIDQLNKKLITEIRIKLDNDFKEGDTYNIWGIEYCITNIIVNESDLDKVTLIFTNPKS